MYTLNIANNSTSNGTFVIFQVPDETNLHALAWKTVNLRPHEHELVSWDLEYDFMCGECSFVQPGALFKSALMNSSNGSTRNEVQDTFTIVDVNEIPMHKLALGISLSGSPVFIAEAAPMSELDLPQVNKKYFVSFGNFQEGEVLDLSVLLSGAAEVDFGREEQYMLVSYEANETWVVR